MVIPVLDVPCHGMELVEFFKDLVEDMTGAAEQAQSSVVQILGLGDKKINALGGVLCAKMLMKTRTC